MIDPTYLPFTDDDLKKHFLKDADGHLAYYRKSAERYHRFLSENPALAGIPLSKSKFARQIEKDERFWVATAMKKLYDSPFRQRALIQLLSKTYGDRPPLNSIFSWDECISGNLQLYFEVTLPSPPSYVSWLRENIDTRELIPYVLDAAKRDNARTLEGPTHVDSVLLNADNGFSLFIEAKVLSDVSYQISFDNFRNQIVRSIDVMLENNSRLGLPLSKRDPDRSLFALLTPATFKQNPKSRLYGWLMEEYTKNPEALQRDMPHRETLDWKSITKRIGWLTYEDIEKMMPGACSWLR
jgi:hypothetical protein